MFKQNSRGTGRVENSVCLYPGQTVSVEFKCSNATSTNATDIAFRYNTSFSPSLSRMSAFNCTVSPALSAVTFMFDASGLTGTAGSLSLGKFFDATRTGKTFAYSAANATTDGSWWLTDTRYGYIPSGTALNANATYFVCYTLQDNGAFDADPAAGVILDPIAIGSGAGGGSGSSSSGSGCALNPSAGFGADLLLLLAGLAALRILRRRAGQGN